MRQKIQQIKTVALDNKLNLVAFINGAVVLIVELVAARIIAPYFGSSFFVWTSIIGVILASLSAGYWWGGKLADLKPQPVKLAKILTIASLLILFAAFVQHFVLVYSAQYLPDIRLQSLVSALLLFAPASVVLGIVSPYIARLELHKISSSGRAIGTVFAAGTLGSIVGVFVTGYFLFGYLGSTKLLLVCALLCIANSFILNLGSWLPIRTGIVLFSLIMLVTNQIPTLKNRAGIIDDIETEYSRYLVTELSYQGKMVRILQTDFRAGQSAVDPNEPERLVFDYYNAFEIYKRFNPSPSFGLLVGGGANAFGRHFAKQNPNAQLDVIEIDPSLQKIAKNYFFDKKVSNISIFAEDGRTFVNRNTKKYDVIFLDAFNGSTIPFQLTTREFITKLSQQTTPSGVVLANVISNTNQNNQKFLKSFFSTYKEVFPFVQVFAVTENYQNFLKTNILVVASKNPLPQSEPENEIVARLLNQKVNVESDPKLVLYDELAPVEQYLNL